MDGGANHAAQLFSAPLRTTHSHPLTAVRCVYASNIEKGLLGQQRAAAHSGRQLAEAALLHCIGYDYVDMTSTVCALDIVHCMVER